jgi:hypothetical protein
MRKWTKAIFILSIFIVYSIIISGGLYAQCYGSLDLAPNYFQYNYLVRLAVHFGDVSTLPEDVICSRTLGPGESPVEIPVYFYNAHSGILGVEFAVESCDSIASFLPQNGFAFSSSPNSSSKEENSGFYRMDINVERGMPLCGPALIGYAYIIPSGNNDPIWMTIVENTSGGGMFATDQYGYDHYAFSPHHGGYVGSSYMYTCQDPMCEEPNLPVLDFEAEPGYASSVKLMWTAGGGDHTLIRYATDRFPEGYGDGEFLVNVATVPGELQQYTHVDPPRGIVIYYTAFSVTSVSDEVIRDSFVECGSSDTTFFEKLIATELTSWGALKSKMGSR